MSVTLGYTYVFLSQCQGLARLNRTAESLQKQTTHKEHTYASEDSGACDAETETKRAHKSQQTTHSGDVHVSAVVTKILLNYSKQ